MKGEDMRRPVTTLFMLMSLDGKISTGAADELDVDWDFPKMPGVAEGLYQYYDIERMTDLWSLNSGRVQAKVGVNEKPLPQRACPVSFVVMDNHHLTEYGVRYFCALSKRFVLVTSNRAHPAYGVVADNMSILFYERFDPAAMLHELHERFGCERLTVQTGGTLNALFLRAGLIDYIDVVVAPVLIGGRDMPTLVDGESLHTIDELTACQPLALESCRALEHSYVRLRYRALHNERKEEN